MNIQDCISSATRINAQIAEVPWAMVVKQNKMNVQQAKGETPYHFGLHHANLENSHGKNSNARADLILRERIRNTKEKITEDRRDKRDLLEITSSVREATGGWNTQSNQVMEWRHKKRQELAETNAASRSDSLNTSFITVSSATTDSYHTALTSITPTPNDFNTLNVTNDIEEGISKMNIEATEKSMREERLNRFLLYQSPEDEDVYTHPIDQLKQDQDWRKERLKRKGTEVTYSARSYYINDVEDSFGFEINSKPKKYNQSRNLKLRR